MPQQAKGSARPLKIEVDVAWHEDLKQPLVSLQINDGGAAMSPEGAIQLGITLIAKANASLHEAHMRSFLTTVVGMDPVQVVAALVSFRKLADVRTQRRIEEAAQLSVFMHEERVATAGGDVQRAYEDHSCVRCGSAAGAPCDKEK